MKENVKKHPAFGLFSINQCYGGGGEHLFGSDVQNPTFVEIAIKPAEVEIDEITGEERIYASSRLPFIKVKMSNLQFSDAIFNHNLNDGVPCTVVYNEGHYVEDLPKEIKSKGEKLQDFYKEKMEKVAEEYKDKANRVQEIMKKNYISKEEKEEIAQIFQNFNSVLTSNFPFYIKMFQEQTQKVIVQAKSELDNVLNQVITNKGMEALGLKKMNNPSIIENKEEE